tara:strand:- start:91 stop:483 length:393 start_codon:yes stop_codon:yes gene_type:complete
MKIKGAVVVLEKEGKFLLQLRDDTEKIHHPNKWGLFGGHIENGETPIDAAIREIKEELEINLDKKLVKKIHEFSNEEREMFIFRSPLKEKLSEIKLNEGQDMKLFSKEEISEMDNLVLGLNRLIENIDKH